ncbi:MAG: hypothetical protein JWQ04_2200 [Pedosphaera sp.]|nr:hypothetical protein [Pedosphaera sp.]
MLNVKDGKWLFIKGLHAAPMELVKAEPYSINMALLAELFGQSPIPPKTAKNRMALFWAGMFHCMKCLTSAPCVPVFPVSFMAWFLSPTVD